MNPIRIDENGNKFGVDGAGTIHRYNENEIHHCLNGPALEYTNGKKSFYIEGEELSVQDYWKDPRVIEFNAKFDTKTPKVMNQIQIDENGNRFRIDNGGAIHRYNEHEVHHCLNGPAIQYTNGKKIFYIDGLYIANEQDYWAHDRVIEYAKTHSNLSQLVADKIVNGYKPAKEEALKKALELHKQYNDISKIVGFGATFYVHNETGNLHRLDGPALIKDDGTELFYINGTRYTANLYSSHDQVLRLRGLEPVEHKTRSPTCIEERHDDDNTRTCVIEGTNVIHNAKGPAVTTLDNSRKIWIQFNEWHRLDGPAVELANGTKCFYIEGKGYFEADYWADPRVIKSVQSQYQKDFEKNPRTTDQIDLNTEKDAELLHKQICKGFNIPEKYVGANATKDIETEEDVKGLNHLESLKQSAPQQKELMSNPTIDKFGTKHWIKAEGQLHRHGGPAVEYNDGRKEWFVNGERHRLDGPAVEEPANGSKKWFLEGNELTEEEYWKDPRSIKSCKAHKAYQNALTTTTDSQSSSQENNQKEPNKKMSSLKNHATRGLARVISDKVTKYVKNALVKMLDDFSTEEVSSIKKFLDSPVGELMISGLIGTTLPKLSILPESILEHEYYTLVSDEFMVNACAIGEGLLIDKGTIIAQHLIEPILSSISSLPGVKQSKAFEQIRVAVKSVEDGDTDMIDVLDKLKAVAT
jgi:hypothetical protein